jgi:hypothetical protein
MGLLDCGGISGKCLKSRHFPGEIEANCESRCVGEDLILVAAAYEAVMLTVGPIFSVLHVVGNQETSDFTFTCTLTKAQNVSFRTKCFSDKLHGFTFQKPQSSKYF